MIPDVREILRRILEHQPDRAIARDLGLARKTVQRYRALAERHGWLTAPLLSTEELARRLAELSAPAPPQVSATSLL